MLVERRVTDRSRAAPTSMYDNGLSQSWFRKLLKLLARRDDDGHKFQRLLPAMRSFFQCLIWTFSSSIVRISMKYFRQMCSPTSGALTADDCVQRAGGYEWNK